MNKQNNTNALALLNTCTSLVNNSLIDTIRKDFNEDIAVIASNILTAEKATDISDIMICVNTNDAIEAIDHSFNPTLTKGKKKRFSELMGISQSEVTRRCNIATLINWIDDNIDKICDSLKNGIDFNPIDSTVRVNNSIEEVNRVCRERACKVASKYPKSALMHIAKCNENFLEDVFSQDVTDMSVRNIEFCLGAFNIGSYALSVMSQGEVRIAEYINRIDHIRKGKAIKDYGKPIEDDNKTDSKTDSTTENTTENTTDSKTDSKTDNKTETVNGVNNIKVDETGKQILEQMKNVLATLQDIEVINGIIQICHNRKQELEKKSNKK